MIVYDYANLYVDLDSNSDWKVRLDIEYAFYEFYEPSWAPTQRFEYNPTTNTLTRVS